jgi:rod shape-determining protein MreD
VKALGAVLGLVAALTIQTTLSGMLIGGTIAVNLVLVAVMYLALTYGPVTGLLAGAAAGLTQDALAGGIIGLGGLSKTLVGFVVGVLGTQFIVSQTLPRFVLFVAATFVHEVVFESLQALIEARPFAPMYSAVLTQAAVNALIGVLAFWMVENGPGILARRSARRAAFSKRRF